MAYNFKNRSRISGKLIALWSIIFINSSLPVLASDTATFDESTRPSAPDYSQTASWAALPTIAGASSAVPSGANNAIKNSNVDVFYVHPTTLKNKTVWNQDLNDQETNAWTDASVIARQASVFNHCCEIYAPRYRQASFKSAVTAQQKEDGEKAYQLAYSAILRAFDYYLKHNNHGRPVILAGHSQGALMTYWLLRDRIDEKPLQKQLVTAYVIGIDLMQGDFGRTYHSLKLCATPEQTGCVLAWNSATNELNIDMMNQFVGARYAALYNTQEGRQGVCINPLTFDAKQTDAPASASKGSVPGKPGEGPLRALEAGKVAAHCEGGFLIVDVDPELDLTPLPGGSMHYHDIGLFYADIQANLAVRIKHFLKP